MRIEQGFIADMRNILQTARSRAYAAINFSMAHDYWNVGHSPLTERKTEFCTLLVRELVEDLPGFLLGLEKGFCYVKNQVRMYTEIKSSYIDLVFYNRFLKCFILVSFTTGEYRRKDRRQMEGYLHIFDERNRTTTDNPTIGVILCTNKYETIVKYWVPKLLYDAKLRHYLPTEAELISVIEGKKRVIKQQLKTTQFQ